MALAYFLISIHLTYKAAVRRERCPVKVCKVLNTMFQAISEASMDAWLSKLHIVELERGENNIVYWNKILE